MKTAFCSGEAEIAMLLLVRWALCLVLPKIHKEASRCCYLAEPGICSP